MEKYVVELTGEYRRKLYELVLKGKKEGGNLRKALAKSGLMCYN